MKYQTLGNKVLIKPIREEQSAKGILLPEASKKQTNRAQVICTGLGDHEFSVKVGDTVVFAPYAGHALEIDSVDHIILAEEHIIAILEE
jgi:co-chaperonin GroES (HSP10)